MKRRISASILMSVLLTLVLTSCAGAAEVKLNASDGAASDEFGGSVSISGDYAIVGAHGNADSGSNSGSAYIFKRNGISWGEQAKITASDGAESDYFGYSTSISGDYAIVGAYLDDDRGISSGSAYIFKRNGTSWNQQVKINASDGAAGDHFGHSVSISGDYTIVGACGNADSGSNSGSAYIFKRDGTLWSEQAKITASDGAANDYFSHSSVSISDDYAIVGAYLDDDRGSASGSAYIFKRNETLWSQQAKINASDGAAYDYFGISTSISGDYAIVGTYGDDDSSGNSGSAYIFKRNGTLWSQQAKVTASDGAAGDHFGYSASISGDYAIVGARYEGESVSYSGSAYIFKRNGTLWSQQAKVTASDGAAGDHFGYSASISGDYAIVGAHHDDDPGSNSGSAYVYDILTRPPPDPTNLRNTIDNYWVNYTWQAGTGNVTDSYNVNMNGIRTNGTTATFLNTSVGADGWANITVWAWNTSGTGTLSAGCVSDEVQASSEPSPPTFNCTCGDICVNTSGWWRDGGVLNPSGTPIQAAVNAAAAGEIICVGAGSYTENVNVNKQLTLAGEGADVVTVTAASTLDRVFEVTADYVNISGFNVTGTTGFKAGIYLGSGVDHCIISDNTAPGNYYGIHLYSSSNNTLVNNTVNSNTYGICLYSCNYNTLTSNTVSLNNDGIHLYVSSNNLIYNNYFNNSNNAYDDGSNIWNTTPTTGTNIIGRSWIGGNYWSDYSGNDMNGDGLGDILTPYDSSDNIQNGGDYHPLVQAATIYTPPDPTNLANTTGDYWVNYTWSPGMGNVTDSYNVNLNGVWTNEIADAFVNVTVGPSGWANITVLAYNASGTGTLSEGSVSDSVQAPAGPLTIISIESVAAGRGESETVPITVFNVVDMGGCEITFTYDPTVVYVTDVARGDMNFSFEYNINNGSGWMRANALDVYGQNGNVVFAYVTLAAVGNKSDVSEMEFEYSRLLDASFGEIAHIRDNGTFSILPNVLPEVTNVSGAPGTILYDNGRPRTPGTNITSLSAYVTDADGNITAVTINLSSIGGSPAQPMEPVSGDLWTLTTNATEVDINAPNFTHQLTITATDDDGGINDSASIELTVLKRGDVNGDGLVDKADADYISRYLAGLEPEASNPPGVLAGDVVGEAGNPLGDGVVDLMDALYIAKYTSNMEEEP